MRSSGLDAISCLLCLGRASAPPDVWVLLIADERGAKASRSSPGWARGKLLRDGRRRPARPHGVVRGDGKVEAGGRGGMSLDCLPWGLVGHGLGARFLILFVLLCGEQASPKETPDV